MNSDPAPPASYVVTPDSWTQALDLKSLFEGVEQPLELELGCGKGRFLTTRAAQHPDRHFIGIDRQLTRLHRVERKLLRAGLRNVRLLRIENAYAVTHMLPPESVSACYIFFPDPWPKRRHHDRRLINAAFLDSLHRVLRPGGVVNIRTDYTEYGESIAKLFSATAAFLPIPALPPAPDEITEFEELFMAQGLPITRLAYQRA